MATKRPRLSVVLPEHVAETVRRLARVQDKSVSAVIAELLTELEPGLARVAELGEAFETASERQREAIREAVNVGAEDASGPLQEALEIFFNSTGVPQDRPPLGNTGVRIR